MEKGRVILRKEKSDYINANFVKVCLDQQIPLAKCTMFCNKGIQARQSFHCSTISHEKYNQRFLENDP